MISTNVGTTWNNNSYEKRSVPLQLDRKCAYLESVVDGGTTIKDPKYFTRVALGMPGKGEMEQVIE